MSDKDNPFIAESLNLPISISKLCPKIALSSAPATSARGSTATEPGGWPT